MDIFRFIDSADIRRYLAEIRYRFSTEEKMFLIWYCKAATLNEKIAAWQEIVGYVPSCPWDDAWDIRERVIPVWRARTNRRNVPSAAQGTGQEN